MQHNRKSVELPRSGEGHRCGAAIFRNSAAMMPSEKLTKGLDEIRLDMGTASSGKIRIGLSVTIAAVIVATTGWPPGDVIQRGLFFVLGVLPAVGVGLGLVVGELIHARSDRRGQQRADDREVRALQARIAEETGRGSGRVTVAPVARSGARRDVVTRRSHNPHGRPPDREQRRLVTRRRAQGLWRSGVLGLR